VADPRSAASVAPKVELTIGDRVYLVARFAMTGVLVALYGLGLFEFGRAAVQGSELIFRIGLALLVIAGVAHVLALFTLRIPGPKAMWIVLPFDLVAAGLLIWSTSQFQDPFYPWMLGLSIAFAGVVRRRGAWVVAGLAASVYLVAHFAGHGLGVSLGEDVLIVFKAGGLIFTGGVIADAMERQVQREKEIVAGRESIVGLNEQLGRRLAELHAISEITEIIHSSLDFDRVGPLVLEILRKVIDLPASCLFVIDKDKDETLFSASAGMPAAAAASFNQAYAVGADNAPAGNDLFACMTVLDHNRMMVVFCASAAAIERMSDEDRLVLQAVAGELVVAVENSQLYKLTKRLSITDELTGMFNYRYLQQRLDDEIERARRYGRSLSLLMLDADDFKGFNDTHGHIAGDVALAELGEVMRSSVREIDVVCRYGGEEFSVILPETDSEGAFVVAEKIRENIATHLFADADGNRLVHVTVSIGLATFPGGAPDKESLLRQADDALYQAKHLGRDRVRFPTAPKAK
jgi:diguanylate cyclase (GGDEF)-like protein